MFCCLLLSHSDVSPSPSELVRIRNDKGQLYMFCLLHYREKGLLKVKALYDVTKDTAISPTTGRSVPSSETTSRGDLFVSPLKNVEGAKKLKLSGQQSLRVFAEYRKQRANFLEMGLCSSRKL